MRTRLRTPVAGPLIATALLLLAACSADPLNIVVLSARAPGDECKFDDDTLYVSRGSLDLTPFDIGGATFVQNRYYQVFGWQNNLQPNPLTVGGQVVDPGTGNDFIADSIVYEYQYSDPSVVFTTESANMHAVISAGGTSLQNSVPTDLLQPQAFTAINNSTAINSSAQTLLVTFQIFGRLAAGGSKNTNKVSFPLTIRRLSTTPVDCAALTPPEVPNGGACGFPGRDIPVSCIAP
jgi:hypothetical protein